MGLVKMGVPRTLVLDLAKLNSTGTFVETGTFRGGTCRWAAEHFEKVHTIERAEGIYESNQETMGNIPNLQMHLGDSRDVLPEIVKELGSNSIIHWLDGHWSGGPTAGEEDECPLIEELQCLVGRANDIVLIDDARMVLSAPPLPHDAQQWPTIAELLQAADGIHERSFVQVIDDVIIITPDTPVIRERVIAYARERAVSLPKPNIWKSAKRILGKLVNQQ